MLCITWIEDEFLEIRSVYSWGIMYTMWWDELCCVVSCSSLCAWRLIRAPIQRCGRVWPVYVGQFVSYKERNLGTIEILIYQHEEARFGTKSAKICTLSQKSDSRWRSTGTLAGAESVNWLLSVLRRVHKKPTVTIDLDWIFDWLSEIFNAQHKRIFYIFRNITSRTQT